ncbi:MAG TPA: DNA-3-methyladenine glycosylase, partial [Conexibacter sp.]|nr:DNA-3-methyladenine glycosylase [Conexibacter sp.]
EGVGAAVLIRALEPIEGLEFMRARRGDGPLTNGPGKLTQAMGIELTENDTSLTGVGPIAIAPAPAAWQRVAVVTGPRVGITKAVELPWRFCVRGSIAVSRPRPCAAT